MDSHEDEVITCQLSYRLSKVDIGNVIDMWEAQKTICGGNHEDFAKHLLILHRAFCANYCEAEALQRKVLTLLQSEGNGSQHGYVLIWFVVGVLSRHLRSYQGGD